MNTIAEIGKLLAEAIVNESGICFYPGRFKPPHKGHVNAVIDLASRTYINKIIILISNKEVDGISADDSLAIWKLYLDAQPIPKAEVKKCESNSPVVDIIKYLQEHPGTDPVYIVTNPDEEDDRSYVDQLKQNYGKRIKEVQVQEKTGTITSPYVRDLIQSADYDGFKEALPDAAIQKGKGPEIFKILTGTMTESTISNQSPLQDIYDFVNWCADALGIQDLPDINFVSDQEFSYRESSFGGYNPDTGIIHVVVINRNLADILRTLAHELVHHKQREAYGTQAMDGETGSGIENEANAVAGMIMRKYGKENPHIYGSIVTEGAPGTFKAKITRTYGGPATIAKAKKFKARKNATTLDKKQANWFINMHSK